MPAPRRFDYAKFYKLYMAGETLSAIADKFGCTPKTVERGVEIHRNEIREGEADREKRIKRRNKKQNKRKATPLNQHRQVAFNDAVGATSKFAVVDNSKRGPYKSIEWGFRHMNGFKPVAHTGQHCRECEKPDPLPIQWVVCVDTIMLDYQPKLPKNKKHASTEPTARPFRFVARNQDHCEQIVSLLKAAFVDAGKGMPIIQSKHLSGKVDNCKIAGKLTAKQVKKRFGDYERPIATAANDAKNYRME